MLEPAVVALRLLQYAGAMVLMGSSLFFIYALPSSGDGSAAQSRWTRPLLISAGLVLALAAILGLAAQSSVLAGSVSEGLKVETLKAVVSGMDLGKAAIVRAVAAILAVVCLVAFKPDRRSWTVAAALGAIATASLAWMGHGAATEGALGQLHLASDVLHALAAAFWIGALAAFFGLLAAPPAASAARQTVYRALHGFSGIGSALVAVLVVTGLINSWILVGLDHLSALWTTPYGRLLSLKLILFIAMLGLAAANRFRHTPALGRVLGDNTSSEPALRELRRSVVLETALGVGVLATVAWLGALAPPMAM
ncbi:MAG: copper homeostasis membrane protein CopD [Phenylobacterium sp.]|uniref:copper homeostasis membrane protein CopD n=1 Tax=Phenylobacterium sp. TaxID=1871053 RepID=UPI0027260E7B|nr:copper homeostasis membrane protein CopD [Phenylobacterium sp.]MDO8912612.1 copper homeostasis membrane protein CopD [Phenylobacterium sp.]MDP3101669.1 copper homeostasis membrane protein CopD [Phenylobacterium sp.]